jgi:uncharacterized protein (TIGR02588 family)
MATQRTRQIPSAERIASLAGLMVVVATIGFLGYEALRWGAQEPALSVMVVAVRESAGGFVVDVEVRNHSRAAAAEVNIAARRAGEREVQAQARIDYVPGFSSRRVSLIFESDPGRRPTVRVVGYSHP